MKAALGPRLRVAILAAGYSTRLGQPKALARVHGISLLKRTLRTIAPLVNVGILVIAPPRLPRMTDQCRGIAARIVINSRRSTGLSSSVQRALRAARPDSALLLLPVDLAQLKPRDIARLIARWRGHRRRLTARSLGVAVGIPLRLPKHLFARAAAIVGDIGLRDFVGHLPLDWIAHVGMPSAASDVDTPQDLAQARRRFYCPARRR